MDANGVKWGKFEGTMMSTAVDEQSGYGTIASTLIGPGKKYCGEAEGATVSIEVGGTNCGKEQGYMVAIPLDSA